MNSPSTMSVNSSQGSDILLRGESGSLYMILTPYAGWQWIITPTLTRSISSVSSISTRTSLPETPIKRKTPRIERKLKKRRLAETTSDLPEQLELFSDNSTVASFMQEDESSRDSWPLKNDLAWLEIEPLKPGEEDMTDLHCSEQLPIEQEKAVRRCESPGLEGFVLE